MSHNEQLSDGMDELQELIAEYEAKARKGTKPSNVLARAADRKPVVLEFGESHEVPMDKVIFGDKEGLLQRLAKAAGEPLSTNEAKKPIVEKGEEARELLGEAPRKGKKRKPAWVDPDDEETLVGDVKQETKYTGPVDHLDKTKTYKKYLEERHNRIMGTPQWASLDYEAVGEAGRDADDEEVLRTSGYLSEAKADALQPHYIKLRYLRDLNRATYAEGAISSIQFHPTSSAALVAGESGIVTIYSVDGVKNEKLHSVRFKDYPIKCARIATCGTKAYFGGDKHYYFTYDLVCAKENQHFLNHKVPALRHTNFRRFQVSPCERFLAVPGDYGMLHILYASSNELMHTFKIDGVVAGICFTADSQQVICNTRSCSVYIFSIRQRRLEHWFIDDGCISGGVLGLAPNQRMLATGSREGVVNVYDYEAVQQSKAPLPAKTFLNLTTSIWDLKFNHSSEVLAMCSAAVPAAVKLAHFPSGTVFANFPAFQNNLGQIRTVEFSPLSGFLALGSRERKVPMFRLKHYRNY